MGITVQSIERLTPTSSVTNANSLVYRVTFSEAASNVDASDFTLSGTTATISVAASASPNAFDLTVSGGDLATLNGTVTLGFSAGQDIADSSGGALTSTMPSDANEVTYSVDTAAPTLAISSNSSMLRAGQTATITFIFSEDPGSSFTWDGSTGSVSVSGGTLSAISGSGLTRTATFTPTAATNTGTASITVAAGSYTDAVGNPGGPGASPSLTYDTLTPAAPVLTTPANGSTVGSKTPTVSGTAEAGTSVTIYADGANVGSITADGSGNWSFAVPSALAEGSHTFRVTATDGAGNTGASSNTNTVTVDSMAPTVNSVAVPANATYGVDQPLDFTVNLNEVVYVSGTPQISLVIGSATVPASYVSGSGSNALTFRATVIAGQADADGITLGSLNLNGGTIRDLAGNDASTTLNSVGSTAGVLVDGVAPTVTISSSAAQLKAGETATITFTFNKDPGGTFTNADVSVSGGTLGPLDRNGSTYTATFTPTADTNNGVASITVAAGSYTDAAGNAGGAGASPSLTFDTLAPSTPILSLANDTGSSASDRVTREAALSITKEAGATLRYSVDGAASSVSYDPAALADGIHTVSITQTDAAGNVSPAGTLSFTLDTTAPVVAVTSAGGTVASTSQRITGTVASAADVGATITLTEESRELGTAVVQADRTWGATVDLGSYAEHNVTAKATDTAGNSGSAQVTYKAVYVDPGPSPSYAGF